MPFTIERNDLAAVEADAIVVAANERLEITGGVGAAVARAAGFEQLQAACSKAIDVDRLLSLRLGGRNAGVRVKGEHGGSRGRARLGGRGAR